MCVCEILTYPHECCEVFPSLREGPSKTQNGLVPGHTLQLFIVHILQNVNVLVYINIHLPRWCPINAKADFISCKLYYYYCDTQLSRVAKLGSIHTCFILMKTQRSDAYYMYRYVTVIKTVSLLLFIILFFFLTLFCSRRAVVLNNNNNNNNNMRLKKKKPRKESSTPEDLGSSFFNYFADYFFTQSCNSANIII